MKKSNELTHETLSRFIRDFIDSKRSDLLSRSSLKLIRSRDYSPVDAVIDSLENMFNEEAKRRTITLDMFSSKVKK